MPKGIGYAVSSTKKKLGKKGAWDRSIKIE